MYKFQQITKLNLKINVVNDVTVLISKNMFFLLRKIKGNNVKKRK